MPALTLCCQRSKPTAWETFCPVLPANIHNSPQQQRQGRLFPLADSSTYISYIAKFIWGKHTTWVIKSRRYYKLFNGWKIRSQCYCLQLEWGTVFPVDKLISLFYYPNFPLLVLLFSYFLIFTAFLWILCLCSERNKGHFFLEGRRKLSATPTFSSFCWCSFRHCCLAVPAAQ